jgi:hypothetical protein
MGDSPLRGFARSNAGENCIVPETARLAITLSISCAEDKPGPFFARGKTGF